MDNVSKALIMAGGVLLAIMIIGLSMYLLGSARSIAKISNDKVEASAIESFNRYYTTFGNRITGIDVLNIANKVENDKNNGHDIEVIIDGVDVNVLNNETLKSANERNNQALKNEAYNYTISKYDSDGYIKEITIN